jgi:glutaminyl-peptide cyclotransferase
MIAVLGAVLALLALGEFRCAGDEPPPPAAPPVPFDGKRALQDAARMVAFGPRPAGSAEARLTQNLIIDQLQAAGLVVRQDAFTAKTPAGELPMKNIVGVLAGKRPGVIIIAAHYDTKRLPQARFVGANDGGAGTGAVLELARTLAARGQQAYTYWFVFFDGEESVGEWSEEDSLYGSRHFVQMLRGQNLLGQVHAMILLDLIGDADLTVLRESNSYTTYRELFWETARDLGYGKYFLPDFVTVGDDHVPFLEAGIRSVDLIDFMYGDRKVPGKYWHTPEDTMDKISAGSLQIVGEVVLATLPRIERLVYVVETRAGYLPPREPGAGAPPAGRVASGDDVVGAVLDSPLSVPAKPAARGPGPLAP